MKSQLKKITDITVNELLNNEVILPSLYFEKFDKNAKNLEINLADDSFKKEISKILIEDYNNIDKYMQSIISNVSTIGKVSKNAKEALINKDVETLSSIYRQMQNLEKEVKKLSDKLFYDEITNTYNRKWVYNKFLNKEAQFKSTGIAILVDINDYVYLKKEYGELLANNLLIFATNFIKKSLKEELLDFKIVRFFDNQFLIFIKNAKEKEVNDIISNTQRILSNTTLKSNSGLFIKANYKFKSEKYAERNDSKDIFEKLFTHLKEE